MSSSYDFSWSPIAGVSQTASTTLSPLQLALNVIAPLPALPGSNVSGQTLSTQAGSVGQPLAYLPSPTQTTAYKVGSGSGSSASGAGMAVWVGLGAILLGGLLLGGGAKNRGATAK